MRTLRVLALLLSPVVALTAVALAEPTPTFYDDFSRLDSRKWTVSTWVAPGRNNSNNANFSRGNVAIVQGMLRLTLTQTQRPDGSFVSIGGALTSKQMYGYGTYEWVMKPSSDSADPYAKGNPVSGTITGLFNYLPGSRTEIDIEVEGGARSNLHQFSSWISDSAPKETTKISCGGSCSGFRSYKFVWTPKAIKFYVDDVLQATHTKVIPAYAGYVMMNHWGTNDPNWGGVATPGTRYMWVKSFSFTAADPPY